MKAQPPSQSPSSQPLPDSDSALRHPERVHSEQANSARGNSVPRRSAAGGTPSRGTRRHLALATSLVLLVTGYWLRYHGGDSALAFASTSMLRIGLVFGVLWIAWPSLRRPTQWLAPGMAVIFVLTLVVIAANPRLALVAVPAAGTLVSIGAVIRMFRSSK